MISTVFAMAMFSLIMSISPGPVNLISMSIGINRGFKAAIPFVSGATIGFATLLFLIGLGLEVLLRNYAFLITALSVTGSMFVIHLGYKISQSSSLLEMDQADSPAFFSGALLQWLNPKAWGACLAGVAAFGAADNLPTLSLFTGIYFCVCFVGIGVWAFAGERVFTSLNTPRRLLVFNQAMGLCLILIGLFLLAQRLFS